MWQAKRLGTLGVFVRHPPMPLTLVARASSSSRTAAHMHVTSCSRVSNVEHHHELRFFEFVCLGISSHPQVAGARGATLHCRVCLRAKLFPVLILFPFMLWPVWQALERCASLFGSLPCSLWWLKLVPPSSFLHMRCICKLLAVGRLELCNCQLCSFAKFNCSPC